MLILPVDVVEEIHANRGDMSPGDFIAFLIRSSLEQKAEEERFVTREALDEFESGNKELLRHFLEFFTSYGLELGRGAGNDQMEALTSKLQALGASAEGKT